MSKQKRSWAEALAFISQKQEDNNSDMRYKPVKYEYVAHM